jgi:hypothetical protein
MAYIFLFDTRRLGNLCGVLHNVAAVHRLIQRYPDRSVR